MHFQKSSTLLGIGGLINHRIISDVICEYRGISDWKIQVMEEDFGQDHLQK
jgi:hypothetical protein